jgi:hypothetical protein
VSTSTRRGPAAEAADGLVGLMDAAVRMGEDLLDALQGRRTTGLASTLQRAIPSLPMAKGGCGCDIPPPCWMPRDLGEVRSRVCAGGTATLRLRVTNCSASPRKVGVDARPDSAELTIDPSSMALGPLERGVALASLAIPAKAGVGEEREALIWVRGCRDHVLRWTVRVASRAGDCGHEIDVDDCPDLVHHWYDHFYCERPCVHRAD